MLKKLIALPISILLCGSASANPLNVGDFIPALEAMDQDGKSINLTDAAKQGLTLVYFYPKASTGG